MGPQRQNKIVNLIRKSVASPYETTVSLSIGILFPWIPILRSWRRSLRRSLSDQGWGGGVLYVPVKELRVENPPKSNRSCQFLFKEKKEDKESRLTNSVGQIIQSMNELLGERYEEKKENVKAAGKSKSEAQKKLLLRRQNSLSSRR